jgi:hypothetical protein
MEVQEFKPTIACAECKGLCCKHMGCHFSPTDFEDISFDNLKKEIEKGFISIDWWESDVHQYYLRMRHVNAPIVDPSWGGRCVLLTDKGCPLPFEKRPLGARALKPISNGECRVHYSKEMCKDDWLEYSDILSALVLYFNSK